MFYKKLNKKDLEELRKREELLRSFVLIVEALQMQKRVYLSEVLPKYGCDLGKNYNINPETGKIGEIKPK